MPCCTIALMGAGGGAVFSITLAGAGFPIMLSGGGRGDPPCTQRELQAADPLTLVALGSLGAMGWILAGGAPPQFPGVQLEPGALSPLEVGHAEWVLQRVCVRPQRREQAAGQS